MADHAWTANTLICTSGPVEVRVLAEAVSEGDWVYQLDGLTTVGLATNALAAKATVYGQALLGGVTGKHCPIARPGAIIAATAIPALAAGQWLVLSVDGNTSLVADQTSGDEVTLVARGNGAGTYIVDINNTGETVP